ncbi:hypothetical protein [Pseudomonas sp.]|uniref:hypothetical protein n=1 Tax=Pseudomonas sp. TaxID=306 RepID=UPI0028ADB470|nr:hypothetical protein [Pseudomonas sp.]
MAMFRTHKQAEISGFDVAMLSGEGIQVWRYIEQALHCPWLYVSCLEPGTELSMRRMLLIADIHLFEDFLRQDDATSTVIDRIQLVSPSWLNLSSNWKMEELVSLSEVQDHQGKHLAYIYGTADGNEYCEGHVQKKKSIKHRWIYKKP